MRGVAFGLLALVASDWAAAETQEQSSVLYQRAGEPYRVRHLATATAEYCFVEISDWPRGVTFGVQISSSNVIRVSVVAMASMKPVPPDFQRPASTIGLKVDVGGVEQSYGLTVAGPRADGNGLASAFAPPGAWGHLRSALRSRDGFAVTIGEQLPLRFVVPETVAETFLECSYGIPSRRRP